METMVESVEAGTIKTHVGLTVAKGPGRLRLILTRPYHEAGQIVEIPRDQITSIAPVEPSSLGDDPSPAN